MTTRTIRRPIQCLCPHCWQGHVYRYGGKHVCSECRGRAEIVRWINEIVHIEEVEDVKAL